jgi:hypothetical protein
MSFTMCREQRSAPIKILWSQIDLNLEVRISNSHVYGTVTLAVTFTVSNGASHLKDNHLARVDRRNQQPNDFPNGQL